MENFEIPHPKVYSSIKNILKTVLWPTGLSYSGLSNLPENDEPLLLAPTHRSLIDIPLLAIANQRQIHFMAKQELFTPVLGKIIEACGAFPVDRKSPKLSSFRFPIDILKSNGVVAVFPEGTRHRGNRIEKVHTGILRIASIAEAPIYPVGIAGSEKYLGPKHIHFDEPMNLDDINKDLNIVRKSKQSYPHELHTRMQEVLDIANQLLEI